MPHHHESSDFPGKVNAIALGAYPQAIQSAFVHRDEASKHAVIELEWHRQATPEQIAEARRESLAAVLRFLGDGWSGEVRNKTRKAPDR